MSQAEINALKAAAWDALQELPPKAKQDLEKLEEVQAVIADIAAATDPKVFAQMSEAKVVFRSVPQEMLEALFLAAGMTKFKDGWRTI